MTDDDAPEEAHMEQAPEAPARPPASMAPPLGQRPAEPMPGKQSLADPQGKAAAEAVGAGVETAPAAPASGNGGKDEGTCPDCGLSYRDHPEFAHGRGPHEPMGSHGGHEHAREGHLPGEELEPNSLGGDPAGT